MVIEALSVAAIIAGLVMFLKKNKQTNESGIKLDKISKPSKTEVEILDMSFVASYFKQLNQEGKIQQGKHTPFIIKAEKLKQLVKDETFNDVNDNSLFLASYNEDTEEVENVMIVECRSIGESLEKALSSSESGIVTLS